MAATGKYESSPTLAELEAIAGEAFATIPRALSRHVADVAIHVVNFPDDETMEAMELESPFDILGLYVGVSLDQKSLSAVSISIAGRCWTTGARRTKISTT